MLQKLHRNNSNAHGNIRNLIHAHLVYFSKFCCEPHIKFYVVVLVYFNILYLTAPYCTTLHHTELSFNAPCCIFISN